MARFKHASGDWTRDDVERWALLRRLPSSLRTILEMPSPKRQMAELLRKADELYVTLPTPTVSSIGEAPTGGVDYVLTDSARHYRLVRWQSGCLSSLQQRYQMVIDSAKRFTCIPHIIAQIVYSGVELS